METLQSSFLNRKWKICGYYAGYEFLAAVVLKGTIFWDTTQSSPLKVNRTFE
jgi:hypothetical protein